MLRNAARDDQDPSLRAPKELQPHPHSGVRVKRLQDIPLWLFALLTLAAFNAAALVGLVCTRQLGRRFGLYGLIDNGTVGWIFSATLVIYAIAIGLIAVATWTNAKAAANVA